MATGISPVILSSSNVQLIWTNPNAAATTDAGGTYTIENLNNYKVLIISSLPRNDYTNYYYTVVPLPMGLDKSVEIYRISSDKAGMRLITFSNNQITIGEGVYGAATSEASRTCIVQHIWGIK